MIDVRNIPDDFKDIQLNPYLVRLLLLSITEFTNKIVNGAFPVHTVKKQCANHGVNYHDPGSQRLGTLIKIASDLRQNCYSKFSFGDNGNVRYNELVHSIYSEIRDHFKDDEDALKTKIKQKESELSSLGIETLDNIVEKKEEVLEPYMQVIKYGAVRPNYETPSASTKSPVTIFPWQQRGNITA